jgi:predicted AAA+ superfamily ATPase
VDEIHKVPDWASVLKSIYETFPDLTVIASGSSVLKIKTGSGDLSRRALFHHMPGLSLREFMELTLGIELLPVTFEQVLTNHEELVLPILSALVTCQKRVLEVLADYLRRGYYPYFAEFETVDPFWQAVEQDAHVTIEGDLLFVHPELTGNTSRRLRLLLSIISSSVPFTPDLNKLKQAIEVADDRTLKSYLCYLQDGGLIRMLGKGKRAISRLFKPEKIYLDNTNQQFALNPERVADTGTLRETFFASMLSGAGRLLELPTAGDFLVDRKYTVEVGGKGKDFSQIAKVPDSYLFLDGTEQGVRGRVPLWLAGFLY